MAMTAWPFALSKLFTLTAQGYLSPMSVIRANPVFSLNPAYYKQQGFTDMVLQAPESFRLKRMCVMNILNLPDHLRVKSDQDIRHPESFFLALSTSGIYPDTHSYLRWWYRHRILCHLPRIDDMVWKCRPGNPKRASLADFEAMFRKLM